MRWSPPARVAVFALGLCTGVSCTRRGEELPRYELRDVVAPAIAQLEARVGAPTAPTTPVASADARERVVGLLEALSSSDARMREIALEDARTLGAAELAVTALLLLDETLAASTRDAAARVLGEHPGPASGEALCATLETSREPSVRRQCAFQLGRAAERWLWPRMLLRLRYEVDGETVVWLAHALSRRQNLAGLEGLRVLVTTSRDENVRNLAAEVGADLAAEFGAADLDALAARWRSGEFEAQHLPAEPDDRTLLEGWRRVARLSVFDLRQVDDARFVLVDSGSWVVPLLAATLRDSTAYARVHAAQCLERRGARSRSAYAALVDALREPIVAPCAAAALGALGEPRAVEPLSRALDPNSPLELRVAAARALGRLRAPDVPPALVQAFGADVSPDLRQAAAEALLACDERPAAFDALLEILRARRGDVDAAESALGAHLERHAGDDDRARAWFESWRDADVKAGTIATLAETRARQEARARLLETRRP